TPAIAYARASRSCLAGEGSLRLVEIGDGADQIQETVAGVGRQVLELDPHAGFSRATRLGDPDHLALQLERLGRPRGPRKHRRGGREAKGEERAAGEGVLRLHEDPQGRDVGDVREQEGAVGRVVDLDAGRMTRLAAPLVVAAQTALPVRTSTRPPSR